MRARGHTLLPTTLLGVALLAGFLTSDAVASARMEVNLGTRLPRFYYSGPPHSVQPAVGIVGVLTPGSWPIGITGYATGATDWFEAQTLDYPGFPDWLQANYRLLYGAVGVGLTKEWRVASSSLSLSSGLMASSLSTRVSHEDWAKTYVGRGANGEWVSVAVTRAATKHVGVGARARYTWEKYTSPDYAYERAGGLELGLALKLGSQRD